MKPLFFCALLTALVLPQATMGQNSGHAVIVQALLPTEAAGLDWAPEGEDTLNELWNDCFLMYELLFSRDAIGRDTGRVHMLWGQGEDYFRKGIRYTPEWIDTSLHHITDDSACIATVESVFGKLAGSNRHAASSSLTASGWVVT